MDFLDELRFTMQVVNDAKRTLICEPDNAHEVRSLIDSMGASAAFDVKASTYCPPGQIIVLDEQALTASANQTFQRAAQGIRFRRP
ncbi:hypothetical protein ACFXCZ_27135 [Streptomyces sp. NPDC059396]|uniref:hypothetical protein n=1 Tax=Streptomyces sp. NPDC059396 TaxID=3346819 RepID=UPI0036B74765